MTRYFCDLCRRLIDEGEGETDYRGNHVGLCDGCRETHALVVVPLAHPPGQHVTIRRRSDVAQEAGCS